MKSLKTLKKMLKSINIDHPNFSANDIKLLTELIEQNIKYHPDNREINRDCTLCLPISDCKKFRHSGEGCRLCLCFKPRSTYNL